MLPYTCTLDWVAIGARIARQRRLQHWSQRHLADMTSLALDTLRLLETGRRNGYSVRTIVAIACALSMELNVLFWDGPPPYKTAAQERSIC